MSDDPRVWTCPICGVTNAHVTCPTKGCKGKRPADTETRE